MTRTRLALALCATAALALGACASKPKPAVGQSLAETPSTIIPETPAPPSGGHDQGPPLTGQADLAANAGDRVFFALDSHDLEPDARDMLVRQAAWLGRNGDVAALIAGSADERGTREYNLALGARRAAAARAFLVSQGVPASRLETISYGKEQPVDPASNEDAWALNRNAQTLVKPGR
ncbi:MAG: OmpA family protein [Alphaproteobacteria bacterium]|nr:OmpA family protein [Alphaproteobacteria bacterium]MBU1515596.1 OmpA family protein [Alphaproteobacteria bacterium]MBU2096931.1 OmpA family protein [Alphaproteobacteria bacterium]MBU2149586.1 OmpA family protein [Alphaproteobacteria bacterium]MBU2305678.1 OmpA family protein [Alphaproteobacteria bacterium]